MSGSILKDPIINEIESALRADSGPKRTKVLMGVTDLFIGGATNYSDSQTKLFDNVLIRLIERVESSALVEIATRLASIPNAPADTVRQLARNDTIGISGPILSNSPRLTDCDLIEIAKTKSQAHLASIAHRPNLNEDVTDVLVDHGDADVANELAINSSALCSNLTIAKLVMRADGDNQLTESISRRTDIPSQMFHQLLTQATEVVRTKLLASAKPEQKDIIKRVMDEISTQVVKSPPVPHDYAKAERTIAALSQDTNLIRTKIAEFADTKHVAEVIAGLASVNGLQVDQVERLFYAPTCFGLMVLCKASALAWKTTYAVIRARAVEMESRASSHDELRGQFNELSISSAQTLVRFWQGRQKVLQAVADGRRASSTNTPKLVY